jgi:hypothetical protein
MANPEKVNLPTRTVLVEPELLGTMGGLSRWHTGLEDLANKFNKSLGLRDSGTSEEDEVDESPKFCRKFNGYDYRWIWERTSGEKGARFATEVLMILRPDDPQLAISDAWIHIVPDSWFEPAPAIADIECKMLGGGTRIKLDAGGNIVKSQLVEVEENLLSSWAGLEDLHKRAPKWPRHA